MKYNDTENCVDMFDKEMRGLSLLEESSTFRIPKRRKLLSDEKNSFLVMEYIEPIASPAKTDWERAGEILATLHIKTVPLNGLAYDNYIGTLVQHNLHTANWISFFINQRLVPLANMALESNLLEVKYIKLLERLYQKIPLLLSDSEPSLLHGDLWSGNIFFDNEKKPVLIDPAVYYGNREIELAFTKLFGGFNQSFYDAYQATNPLEPGYEERFKLYQLYPLLVHLNLFGKTYLPGINNILKHFV